MLIGDGGRPRVAKMFFTPAAIRSMLDDRGRDPMQVPAGWLAGHTRAQVFGGTHDPVRCQRSWMEMLQAGAVCLKSHVAVDCRAGHGQLACGTSGCSLLIGQMAQPCTDRAADSWLVQCAHR